MVPGPRADESDPVVVGGYLRHEVEWTAEKVQRFWDGKSAQGDGDYFSAMTGPSLVRVLRRMARPRQAARILDLGCGRGHLLNLLARHGYDVAGVDSSPESIEVARHTTQLREADHLRVGDLAAIPFDADSFDVVALVETIEHVLPDELNPLLAEIRRVLAPGGVLFVTTPNAEQLAAAVVNCPDCGARFHPMQHVRTWDSRTLRNALEDAGFTDVRTRETRLPHRGGRLERAMRDIWYALRNDKRHLIAVATSP